MLLQIRCQVFCGEQKYNTQLPRQIPLIGINPNTDTKFNVSRDKGYVVLYALY